MPSQLENSRWHAVALPGLESRVGTRTRWPVRKFCILNSTSREEFLRLAKFYSLSESIALGLFTTPRGLNSGPFVFVRCGLSSP